MRLRLRWTRRKTILVATAAVLLVALGLVLHENSFVRGLPPEVRVRMPWHGAIPWGLESEVRAAIEDCYSAELYDRLDACHRLANMGPRAAPAAPYLVALLADTAPDLPEPPSFWNDLADWPIIGPIINFFMGFGQAPDEDSRRQYMSSSDSGPRRGSSEIACQALGNIGPAAVPALTAALDDPDVCASAVLVLGNIGDPRAGDALAERVSTLLAANLYPGPCDLAGISLCQLRDPRGAEYLEERLAAVGAKPSDYGWYAGCPPLHALARMGPSGWAVLLRGIKSQDEKVRLLSAMGLAECLEQADLLPPETVREMAEAVAPYLKDLQDRDAVVDHLGPLAADGLAAMVNMSDDNLVPQQLEPPTLFTRPPPRPSELREWAAARLAALEHPRRADEAAAPAPPDTPPPPTISDEDMDRIVEEIRNLRPDPDNVRAAEDRFIGLTTGYGAPKDKRFIAPLWELLNRLPPPPLRAPAVWRGHTAREAPYIIETPRAPVFNISRIGAQPSSDNAAQLGNLRTTVLCRLIWLGDTKALQPLLATAADANAALWSVELRLISEMGPAAVPPLEAGLADPSSSVRATAVALLVAMDSPQALAAIRKACNETDTACVRLFMDTCGNNRLTATTDALLVLAEGHRHRYIREWAMDELAKREDPRAAPVLRRIAAGDVCASVRAAAWEHLEILTHQRRPESAPAFWQDEIYP